MNGSRTGAQDETDIETIRPDARPHARYVKANGTKPVVGFIAGQTAPAGRRMGHAGAIIGGKDDTAAAKMAIMRECGITVVESPATIGETMAKALAAKAAK